MAVSFSSEDAIGFITLDKPPANSYDFGFPQGTGAAGNMKMINRGPEALAAIARVPKVFIAQIEGHALGGGLEISLACDLRFGARGSYKLGVPEVTLGLLPGNGGTQRLPRIIGVPKALDLMVTGRAISPGEAHGLGILNRLHAPADLAGK